jgi:tetratricopeptide (TPR) repeat protein
VSVDRGRAGQSSRSLRLAGGSGDLIAEIHAKRRRKVRRRVAKYVVLVVVLVAAGIATKIYADKRARENALANARTHAQSGTAADLRIAGDVLDAALVRDDRDPASKAQRALLRAHLWLEYGEDEKAAIEAIEAAPADATATVLARAMMTLAARDLDGTAALVESVTATGDPSVDSVAAWLRGQLVIAQSPEDPPALEAALVAIDAAIVDAIANASLRRVRARLLLQLGRADEALAELAQAREIAKSHLGLAADEALFNAYLRREASGVASVADQLLELGDAMTPRDRDVTRLARGVVHVRSGEIDDGIEMIESGYAGLPRWDRLAVRLAIETVLEGGAATLGTKWLDQAAEDGALPAEEIEIDRAWVTMLTGDVMAALAAAAKLPQQNARVAYVQALALVEQRRWAEAQPWIDRARQLLPDRIDLEVAAARVELHRGDPVVALRRLSALAEEEPYAPRAWTGVGEAHLGQAADAVDLRKAKAALERAVEREPVPAEAMLLLAEIANRKRKTDPEGMRKAQELLEKAVETNPTLPRYRERLAEFLVDNGYAAKAEPILAELVDTPGITGDTLVRYVRVALRLRTPDVDIEALLVRAGELGVDARTLDRERAYALLTKGTRADLDAAQKKLAAMVTQDPADIPTRVLYAETFARQHDRKEAELAIRRGFPHVPESQKGRLFLAWADIDARLGKAKIAAGRARAAWVRMLDEDRPAPELLPAAELAAKLWVRQDNERVALTVTEQLTERLPLHAEAWTIRAETELAANEAGRARISSDKAIELEPDSARAHEIRGHSLLRFGQKAKARAAYERAIELSKGTRYEKDYRENLKRL